MAQKDDKKKKARTTGNSRKRHVGPDFSYGGEQGGAMGEDMPLAPINPQAGNRYIDENDTIDDTREYLLELDHEEAVAYQDGYVVAHVKGEEGRVGLTPHYMSNVVGNKVEHNHPRTGKEKDIDGGTFSQADLNLLLYNPDEVTAVGKEGVYSLSADRNADVKGFIDFCRKNERKINKSMQSESKLSDKQYEQGYYKDKKEAYRDSGNRQLRAIHRFYEANASKFGINYNFTPSEKGLQSQALSDKINAEQMFAEGLKDSPHRKTFNGNKRGFLKHIKSRTKGIKGTVIYDDGQEKITGFKDKSGNFVGFERKEKRHGVFRGDSINYKETR